MAEETKSCPACSEEIEAQAQICRFCKYDFQAGQGTASRPPALPRSSTTSSCMTPILTISVILMLLSFIAALAIPGLVASRRAYNQLNAGSYLKTIATAEADFRANDRNGNKVTDFWTLDVAGLYCAVSVPDAEAGLNEPIKLIEISVCSADAQPRGVVGPLYRDPALLTYQAPAGGYWFWAITSDLSSPMLAQQAYRQVTGGITIGGKDDMNAWYNTQRFGFLAYPDSLRAGRYCYIINENNTIWMQRLDAEVRSGTAIPPGLPPTNLRGGGQLNNWPTPQELKMYWSRPE